MARKLGKIDPYKILTGRTKGDWMKEAMLEAATGGLGLVARPARIASGIIERATSNPGKAKLIDKLFKEEIRNWLLDKTKKIPRPKRIYRGVRRRTEVLPEGIPKAHATPWAYSAVRGGAGVFGATHHKVYKTGVTKGTRYYRGGGLAGDPLESTRIPSIRGMSWDKIMRRGKELFYRDLTSARARAKKFGEKLTKGEEKYVADKVIGDIYNASFETEFRGRPGIWRGKPVQSELHKTTPPLRSYETMKEAVEVKRMQGYLDEDIPELLILRGR